MFASPSSSLPAVQLVPGGLSTPCTSPPALSLEPPRKKEKKEKHANEAFIVVRPPPSKSTHPLNLQVQLVPPQSRQDKAVHALDSSPDGLETDLRRTESNRSETSGYSGYTSAASFSSFSSTSTTSSGRRMIIPLYNLNVHHVMPSTILDAGTDAKVAKFAKRGLEIFGLAFLEPIEVRSLAPLNGSLAAPSSTRTSFDDTFHEFGSSSRPHGRSPPRPRTPDPPRTRHSVVGAVVDNPTINLVIVPPNSPSDPQPQRGAKKLFSRMFKKKDTASHLSITVPQFGDASSPQPTPLLAPLPSAHRSDEVPVSVPDIIHVDVSSSSSITSSTASHTAVLGVYPTLYPPVIQLEGRPSKYVWVVRKWLKGADTGILNGMMGKLSVSGRDAGIPATPHIEVRFEWSRGQKKGRRRKSRADKSFNSRADHSVTGHPPASRSPLISPPGPQTLSPDGRDHRSSIISQNSSSSDTPSLGSSAHRHTQNSDGESDPEDSETPWTCGVTVQRLGQSPRLQNGERESFVRIKVATLAPTPHHPKVVGLLKMPFPLPDIEVERLAVRNRIVTAQGISKTTTSNAGELVLTAEEIKDTVSSTALWLVVREAFGGLGRERKKGRS